MNREDFLMRLSSLLQDVSEAEREEALQYYEDYFDDAGKDKEEEIIDSLGSPAEVAKNIKKELFGIETEEEISTEDRKLTKYGSQAQREEEQKKATLPTLGMGSDRYQSDTVKPWDHRKCRHSDCSNLCIGSGMV